MAGIPFTIKESGSGTSTFTYRSTRPGRQAAGFCEAHGLMHAWISPEFTVSPGPTIRSCANCGKVQRLVPAQWVDDTESD